MSKPWNMARVASRRELPKQRKAHRPAGERPDNLEFHRTHRSCSRCGYHKGNCLRAEWSAADAPQKPSGIEIRISSLDTVDDEIRTALAKAFADGRLFIV